MNRLDEFLSLPGDGVFYPGHASAIVRLGGRLFAFDPVWDHEPYGEYWTFFPKQVNCDAILDRLEGVFISHIHEDHVCESILSRVQCQVHILGDRPPLYNRLRKFCKVQQYSAHRWHNNIPGVEFMFLPHAFNTIDSSTFIRSDAFCVYHGNDNFLDAKVLNRARTQLGKLDVAFIPYAFIHWYPHLLHSLTEQERGEEAMRLKQQSLQQARDMISVFRPKLSIPAGSSLFYADSAESPLNYSVADPWDLGHGSVPMFAGDYHIKGDEVASHAFTSQPPFAGPIDYQNALYRFLERKKQPPLQNKTRIAEHFLGYIKQKIRSARSINEDHLVIVNNVAIDLNSLQVYTTVDPKPPYTKFAFAAKEFMKWIHGQITLEQAIGTRRFICHREPNVYNLKVFEFINTYL